MRTMEEKDGGKDRNKEWQAVKKTEKGPTEKGDFANVIFFRAMENSFLFSVLIRLRACVI